MSHAPAPPAAAILSGNAQLAKEIAAAQPVRQHQASGEQPREPHEAAVEAVAPSHADQYLDDLVDLDARLGLDGYDDDYGEGPERLTDTTIKPLHDLGSTRVLILNASYEPLHVCSVKRAVGLLMHEVAERVEDTDRVLRSPSSLFPVPSVVRLKRFVRGPFRQRVAFNRKNVFRRDVRADLGSRHAP